jgi:aspartyl-tRNA(Asn)/glutamyl-tRNA(Gln) amidotransferase subunit A
MVAGAMLVQSPQSDSLSADHLTPHAVEESIRDLAFRSRPAHCEDLMHEIADYLTISDARALLDKRQLSSVELTRSLLERIDRVDCGIGAFLLTTPELALEHATRADRRIALGERSRLLGIPMALKDILSTKDVTTTCGSRILEGYQPPYDATVVKRLFDAGAVLLGKTNLDEFAMGSSTENSGYFPVHNPWNPTYVPGGSSGGSAAAVAAGMATFAIGTDTGGSIRQPAALTGTVGLKPTYGRVSRYGLVAFASSLDQIGPVTRTVSDAATVLDVIAGHDPLDSTSIDSPVPSFAAELHGDIHDVRVGVPREYFGAGIEPDVESAVRSATEIIAGLGASVVDVSLPTTDHALSTYYIISPAEAMANLARYDGVRYGVPARGNDIWQMFANTRAAGFGSEVKRRILLGTYALSAGYFEAYYLKAQQVRTLVRQDFERVFEDVDVLVTPTSPTVAFRIGERITDPLQMYLSDVYTVPVNIAGICAISVPCGFSKGLPIGLQIIGGPLREGDILSVAQAFQQATSFHLAHPEVGAETIP